MSDTDPATTPAAGEGGEGAPPEDPTAAMLEQMRATQQAILEKLGDVSASAPAPAPAPAPTPAPAPVPPAPAAGRISRKQYDELAQYASAQRQELTKLQLAQEFGIKPEELTGNYGSPEAMRQHADVLAMRKRMSDLEQRLKEGTQPPGEGTPPDPGAPEDAGGPTGTESAAAVALKDQYDAARALGRTEEGRKALLKAIYADPSRAEPIIPELA